MKNKTTSPVGESVSVQPALFTVEQAAAYLGASTVWAVRRLIYAGRLPYVQVGKRYNIRKTDLDNFIDTNRTVAA